MANWSRDGELARWAGPNPPDDRADSSGAGKPAPAHSSAVAVARVAQRLAGLVDELVDQMAQAAAQLAMAAAEAIIRRQADTDRDMVLRALREALSQLLAETEIRVRVNPADAEAVRQLAAELADRLRLSVVEDDSIQPGGAVVSTPSGEVDASLDGQLQRLRRRVLGEVNHAGH